MGAVLTMGVMAGAILSHLVVLGIEVKGDGGLLFGLALTAFIGSALVLVWRQMCTAHVSPPMSRGQSESTSDTASITSRPYSMPMRRPRCPTIAVSAEPRSRPIRRRPCGRYSN